MYTNKGGITSKGKSLSILTLFLKNKRKKCSNTLFLVKKFSLVPYFLFIDDKIGVEKESYSLTCSERMILTTYIHIIDYPSKWFNPR